jgi:hypothetical protein
MFRVERLLLFVVLFGGAIAFARTAAAQVEETTPPPPDADGSETGVPVEEDAAAAPEHVSWGDDPDPVGPWFGLGVTVYGPGGPAMRLEAGIPVGEIGPGTIALQLPLFYERDAFSFMGLSYKFNALGFVPGVAFEFVVLDAPGRLSILAEAGGGVFLTVEKTPEVFGMPGSGGRDTNVLGAFRAAGAVRYLFPFGLYLQTQPLGLQARFGKGGGDAAYEFGLLVGYRLP